MGMPSSGLWATFSHPMGEGRIRGRVNPGRRLLSRPCPGLVWYRSVGACVGLVIGWEAIGSLHQTAKDVGNGKIDGEHSFQDGRNILDGYPGLRSGTRFSLGYNITGLQP